MLAAAIASAAIPGEPGLYARYFATAAVDGAHERSTEYHDPAYTRVDERLDFVRGDRDFPLAFFNDHARFNFIRAGQPDRQYLEFAVAWNGWLWAEPGSHTFFLHAPAEIGGGGRRRIARAARNADVGRPDDHAQLDRRVASAPRDDDVAVRLVRGNSRPAKSKKASGTRSIR